MPDTKIEKMAQFISKNRKSSYADIAAGLSWNEDSVERMALILEKAGLVRTHYPAFGNPWAMMLEESSKKADRREEGTLIEEYQITSREGRMKGNVRILDSPSEKRPVYRLELPDISAYMRTYLEHVKVEASKSLPLVLREEGSEEARKSYEARFRTVSEIIVRDIGSKGEELETLSDIVINEMYGLGKLEALIGDSRLEEIVVNSSKLPVSVYHRKHGWLKTNIMMEGEGETENFAEQIARKVGKQISILSPVLDAHLGSGDRANATLSPVSSHGNTITLRLFARNPWTIISYLNVNCLSIEMAAMLWQAMHYEMNVLIAGGTASGKTSTLNGLLGLIQPFQRIVTIEDTRELVLPSYQWNWVPLVTRPPNPEGFGEVTMLDLVVNSLRMRPDRISMGEIRRKREAEVLFEAMHTGHSVYSTIHADTGAQVLKRLIEPPIEVPAAEVEDINLLLVQYRDRRKNIRRTLELSEVVCGVGGPELNRIFNWAARTDKFQRVKAPRRYVEEMNLHTGMTEKEVEADQDSKMAILKWMMNEKLEGIDDVGRVMKAYYADEAAIADAARKGAKPSKVL